MKFVCSCCFCGKGVRRPEIMTIGLTKKDADQTFWCHAPCFRKAMHKAFRDDLSEDLGGPKLKIDWSKAKRVSEDMLPLFLRRKLQRVAHEELGKPSEHPHKKR